MIPFERVFVLINPCLRRPPLIHLAVCDPANDTARVVREAGCGAQVMPGDAKALTDVIRTYRDDSHRVAREGERARAYFDQHFAVEECVSRYEQILCELAK